MTGTFAAPFGPGANIEVYGDEGTLVTLQPGVNPPSNGIVRGARLGEEEIHELVMPERLRPPQDSRDDRLPPFRVFVQRFLDGIRRGTSPAPNFYDGYRCQQVLDAVVESHQTGRWVDIPLE
jgi:predicted dehydrogenase